jgi:hypothetical protein
VAITFGEAKTKIAQFAGRGGKCPSNAEVDAFVREVLDYMLISGEYGGLRTFTFTAEQGLITVPYELDTVLKVKIGDEVGEAWNRWFEWRSGSEITNCLPGNSLSEEPNLSPIVYDLPPGGAHIGTLAICDEDEGAYLIVKGFDLTGRQIITVHDGQQVIGEHLDIEKGKINYTTVRFGRITEVYKSKTNGYVQLLWINPETSERGFLSDYSPLEEKPRYRRFRLKVKCARFAQVTVLGRIRLKEYYADNDLIPFDNYYTLGVAARAVHSNYNGDVQTSAAQDTLMTNLIERANTVKKSTNGQPIEMSPITSGGSIVNIVPNSYRNMRRMWGWWNT